MTWIDGPVVGFDTETTGVDVTSDRLVTAAVVRRVGRTASVTSWLADPGVEIPEAAAAIHGISTAHARRFGRPPHEVLDEVAGTLADALLRGEPVVAFNASFDLSLLDAELHRHGLATLPERIGRDVRVVVDPLVLDRSLDRYRRGKRKLGDLCVHYGVRNGAALHTADVDVMATLGVLDALGRHFPELATHDLDALHDRQVVAHRDWAEGYNAWRTGQGLTGPGAEPHWPLRVPEPALV
jgi:DNA polymerase-3 subunit epsilon